MLNIYAHSLMTATRANTVKLRDVPPKQTLSNRRWLPSGHWWLRPERDIDLNRL